MLQESRKIAPRLRNGRNILATTAGRVQRGAMRWLAFVSIPVFAATPVVEELPRVPATSPEQAAANLVVRPGFHAELMVSEPLVVDPVAMAFDENGRLFVVEMRDYSERRAEKLGRVKLLEDTDGDGRFDKAHVFADGLPWPTAVTCWDGGVFVAASPELLYFKDTDGDHRADVHDTERGKGSFAKALEGLRFMSREGMQIEIAGRRLVDEPEASARAGYRELFQREGIAVECDDPVQLVIFPEMAADSDPPEITEACWSILNKRPDDVMCASSRMVVRRKDAISPTVLACTLIAYDGRFELGSTLKQAEVSVPLNHRSCATFCVLGGAACGVKKS